MRETILLDALKKISDSPSTSAWADNLRGIAEQAITDYSSAPKEGLKWVKASEIKRVPFMTIYARKDGFKSSGYFTDEGDFIWHCKITGINVGNDLSNVEMLDESPAPESEFWTDEVVLEFAKQYRFSSSRISVKDFKEGKGFPYSPAPESGGEEKKITEIGYDLEDWCHSKSEMPSPKEVFEYLRSKNVFAPNKSTPSTSSNSIEQEKKFVGYFHIPCEEHDPIEVEQTSLSSGGQIQKQTWWQCRKCGLLLTPNSEQEDKRSNNQKQ